MLRLRSTVAGSSCGRPDRGTSLTDRMCPFGHDRQTRNTLRRRRSSWPTSHSSSSIAGKLHPKTSTDQLATKRAPAYKPLADKQRPPAQYAATGCLSTTFYAIRREPARDRPEPSMHPERSIRSSSPRRPSTPATKGLHEGHARTVLVARVLSV